MGQIQLLLVKVQFDVSIEARGGTDWLLYMIEQSD